MPPETIEKAAHWFAKAERAIALHSRGLEHQSKGVENCSALINIALATGNIGREGAGCTMITGQGNGQGGREHGQKCDQLPGQRSLTDPAAREHVAGVWGISPEELPQPGYSAQEIMNAIHAGRSKAASRCASTPPSRCPTPTSRAKLWRSWNSLGYRFLPVRNRAARRRGVGREPAGGRRRVTCSGEGRVIHIQKSVDPPGNARRTRKSSAIWRAAWERPVFPVQAPAEIFDELREASRGGLADYYGITYEKSIKQMGSSGHAHRWIIRERRV